MIIGKWIMGGGDISDALVIRKKVFVEEQHASEERDRDAYDDLAMHAVMYDGEKPVATGRLFHGEKGFTIGRVCVLSEYRGQYVGDLLMRLLLWKASGFADQVHMSAQVRVKGFYERFGFRSTGEEYMEEGIPHIAMVVKKEGIMFPSKCGGDCAKKMIGE